MIEGWCLEEIRANKDKFPHINDLLKFVKRDQDKAQLQFWSFPEKTIKLSLNAEVLEEFISVNITKV